jgi:PhzF family phenazine biosynthesis protein
VQECAQGLVELEQTDGRWAFAGPALTRYEPADAATLAQAAAGLRLDRADILDSSWLVHGPQWLALRLASADEVLAVRPDYQALGDLFVGVVGAFPEDDGAAGVDDRPDFEVRGLMGTGVEDPVTGSLNAGLGRWLTDTGLAPSSYIAAQGTVLGRSGRVHVTARDGEVWVAGTTVTRITGTVSL